MKKYNVLMTIALLLTSLQAFCMVDKEERPASKSVRDLIDGRAIETSPPTLDLGRKGLTELTDLSDIPGVNSTTLLNLGGNKLTELPENELACLSNLVTLYASFNKFRDLPSGLGNLYSLQTLSLAYNEISELRPFVFTTLPLLEDLDLSNNQLTKIPENAFAGLNKLKKLGLSNNQLKTLPKAMLYTLGSLQFLFLVSNQLTELPEGIENHPALLCVLLQCNNLPQSEVNKVERICQDRMDECHSLHVEVGWRLVGGNSTKR